MILVITPSVPEFLANPSHERCEFVRGEILEKSPSSFAHGKLQARLGAALLDYGRRTGAGAPASEWHHRFGPEDDIRIYVPDIAFLLAPRHRDPPDYAREASDLMIEILSPSDPVSDAIDKITFYLQNGARRVWIVDPACKRIDIHAPGRRTRRFESGDTLTGDLLPGFELPLAALFAV